MRLVAILLSVFTILAGCGSGIAQTLHVINIADTRVDTDNHEGFSANFDRVKELGEEIARLTNMKIDSIVIKDNDYKCDTIKSKVRDLQVASDDVILFYHSGHGQSPKTSASDTSASNYPSFQCDDPEHPSPVSDLPNLEDISTQLRGKNARLTLTVADSCNKLAEVQPEVGAEERNLRVPKNRIGTLFLQFQGYALVTSSSPDEFSYYYPTSPALGFFTQQFITNLESPMTGTEDAKVWEVVLTNTKKEIVVANPPAHQHPMADAKLNYVPRAPAAGRRTRTKQNSGSH
ncbi:MAG: caspase family protein [Rhodomicrobium sp.]